MEALFKQLREWGCDVDGAMERFLGEEELYRNCLFMLTEDACFENLKKALAEGDIEAAFHNAHTLKGVIANMGVSPMFDIIVQIVEPLREGELEGLMPLYEELVEKKCYLKKQLTELK